jgi:hypothetical protein
VTDAATSAETATDTGEAPTIPGEVCLANDTYKPKL